MMTIFTFGYYGWGSCTPQLVEAVDAVETSRGFELPIFVDIRIRRNVRAKGFVGNAFEKLLGPSRHRWIKSLGNKFIQTRTGPDIQIAEPSAATKAMKKAGGLEEDGVVTEMTDGAGFCLYEPIPSGIMAFGPGSL
jgi:hypothetical protein